MLVWGGSPQLQIATDNGGGRYDPATDTWVPISMGVNVPSSRFFHTAVWTGTEMIVWGGESITSTGGRYCACTAGRLFYRDVDGDGFGDPAVSKSSCLGTAPAGYVNDYTDCNDAVGSAHPGALEVCNGIDDDCNGIDDESSSSEDADADTIHDLCDNCRFTSNATQSDFDHDGEGDACDLNDGLIFEWRNDKTSVTWQAEQGPTWWNVYVGDLDVLRAAGVYSQIPGSNALAARQCGVTATTTPELGLPAPGKVSFSLVAGVTNGVEGSLGSSTSGPRSNANPCP